MSAVCVMVYLYCLVEESSYPPRRGELSFLLSVIWMFSLLPTLFFSCLVLSYLVLVCLTLSYLILSCLVLSCVLRLASRLTLCCLVLPCLVLSLVYLVSRLILSYFVLFCLILSYLVWSDLALSSRRRRQVPASREATRYLGDVMGQQSWEARAFGVRASALLAERFPTEKVAWLAWMVRPPGSELPCFAPFVRGLLHRGVVFCDALVPERRPVHFSII